MENHLKPVKVLSIRDKELSKRYIRFMLYKFKNIIITSESKDEEAIQELRVYSPMVNAS